ncbi:hypothetical protein [Laspinema olomoucense]|uniref:Uncharacterized protein n=1 Tax=Laspinema olomoucense D3b TaxID=2953688 RepID=A0ABT2NAD3_9CYAN|nr:MULTISPECIES: hypothetical protein [unclassified Laspinema]MCT7973631.1 hypothetical protein [Laspinema sp. D3d]MCT7979663.1 hypothetical protein [Laspinema sp. D3b]MCT7989321.1 hypothetical protein [Laspinema sp. D3a]MCT7996097.1 hypothetical protein [Laspinema sp. D3c]
MNGQQTPTTHEPIQSSEEVEKAFHELGRAFTVYWAWKATGLLDRQPPAARSPDTSHRTPPDHLGDSG